MVLLDTHAWIWYLGVPGELSRRARTAIDRAKAVKVSAISVWELYLLVKKGRLSLTVSPAAFVAKTNADPRFEIVAVDAVIAARSVELPDHHADPADRIILATAESVGAPVVSLDARFADYGLCPVIW